MLSELQCLSEVLARLIGGVSRGSALGRNLGSLRDELEEQSNNLEKQTAEATEKTAENTDPERTRRGLENILCPELTQPEPPPSPAGSGIPPEVQSKFDEFGNQTIPGSFQQTEIPFGTRPEGTAGDIIHSWFSQFRGRETETGPGTYGRIQDAIESEIMRTGTNWSERTTICNQQHRHYH